MEDFKIGFWNINGLENKDNEFWNYIESFDFVGLTETWVENKTWEKVRGKLSKKFQWKQVAANRENKKGRAIGGILTGVKKKWVEKDGEEWIKNRNDILVRKTVFGSKVWNIITVYNRGGENEIFKFLEEVIPDMTEEMILIGGDFNVRTAEEGSREEEGERGMRKSKDKIINTGGRALLTLTERKGWIILNGACEGDEEGEWTYLGPRGESVIDYGIVNVAGREYVSKMKIGRRVESDHQPLIINLEDIKDRVLTKETVITGEMKVEIDDWTEEGTRKYKESLDNIDGTKSKEELNVENLMKIVKNAVERRSWKVKTKMSQKWWDSECWEKKKNLRKTLKLFKGGKIEKQIYIEERKKYKRFCSGKKKNEDQKYIEEIKNIKNENEAWKFINKERKRKSNINEEITTSEWKTYFCELLNGRSEKPEIETVRWEIGSELDEITEEEVRESVRELKRNKAAGRDEIKNEAWIYGGSMLVEKIRIVLNQVWKGKEFPEEWKIGLIVPLLKKGDATCITNYRGITLLSTLYKIYATIVNKRLKKEIEEKKILPDTQAGFRKERGTLDNIYILKQSIDKEISQPGGKVYAMFIDLKAAFDSLDRNELWRCMRKRGIKIDLIYKIVQIFTETKCQVKVKDVHSEIFWTNLGVRQGDPLSPTLSSRYRGNDGKGTGWRIGYWREEILDAGICG